MYQETYKFKTITEYRQKLEAGIAESVCWLGYGLDDWEIGVQFPAGARDFSFLHSIQTGSGAYQAS
jgi:hypothetical protein